MRPESLIYKISIYIFIVLVTGFLFQLPARADISTNDLDGEGIASNSIYLPFVQKHLVSTPTPPINPPPNTDGNWPMVAANPQRTSWTPEEVDGNIWDGSINIEWYRPIEAYISENTQIIASNGLLYIATARGLYALSAENGNLVWRFDTELPIGNSPTVADGIIYFGGFDRKIHALDAMTGAHLWDFSGAKAGFSTNPLVVGGKIIAGNRDGSMYAIGAHGTPNQGQLIWQYKTGGPIYLSAAYQDGIVYFAANDNYAYALNIDSGALVWKSNKLPGDGYHSFWPVIYQDKVVFAAANGYRNGDSPGTGSVLPGSSYDRLQKDDLFFDLPNSPIGQIVPDPGNWAQGKTVIDGSRITEYLENNPATDLHLHKPWRRTYIVLNRVDGSEYTFDSDHDGYPEYAPIAFWGSRSGNSYPPLVGPDGVIYQNNVYKRFGDSEWDIPQGKVMGWKIGTPYLSLVGAQAATDEPQAISAGGNLIYRNSCCDRVGDWYSITTPARSGTLWHYNNTLGLLAPGYDLMWWGVTQYAGHPDATGGYGGKGTADSPHNGKNGIYQSHGDQNPIIPYNNRLYVHRSNAIIALGSGSGPGKLPLLLMNPVQDIVQVPSEDELKTKLEEEIQKIVSAGHLRPGYFNLGSSGFGYLNQYFDNPGDTLYTLARAYPYLSQDFQQQIKIYLQGEFHDYFDPVMYSRIGWADGAAREAMPLPPEVANDLINYPKQILPASSNNYQYPPHNYYAMWKYAQIFPEDAGRVYNLAKNKLQVPVPAYATNEFLREYIWEHNAYIASYIGFIKLQQLAGMETIDSQLRTAVTNELNRLLTLRVTSFSKDTPYVDCTDPQHPECLPIGIGYNNRTFNISRNFIFLVPELGDYLHENAQSKVQEAYDDYNYVAPFWFVAHYGATEGEGVMQPLYDYYAIFQAKAYILKETREQLSKYLDVPAFERGDLFYIQNLIAAIEAP